MLGRVTLTAVLALALALAGCLGGGGGDGDETTTPTGSPSGTQDPTASPNPTSSPTPTSSPSSNPAPTGGDNTAPRVTVVASVPPGVPVEATFNITVSDEDGDDVQWTLDADGDGSVDDEGRADSGTTVRSLFTYEEAGTYSAKVTVSDGIAVDSQTIDVVVDAATASQHIEGDIVLGIEGCFATAWVTAGTVPGAGDNPASGTTRIDFEVEPLTIGNAWTVQWTFDQGYLQLLVAFTDADGNIVGSDHVDTPNFGDATQSGTVPEGSVYGILYGCGGPTEAHVVYDA